MSKRRRDFNYSALCESPNKDLLTLWPITLVRDSDQITRIFIAFLIPRFVILNNHRPVYKYAEDFFEGISFVSFRRICIQTDANSVAAKGSQFSIVFPPIYSINWGCEPVYKYALNKHTPQTNHKLTSDTDSGSLNSM